LAILVSKLPRRKCKTKTIDEDLLAIIYLLIHYGGIDAHGTFQYKRSGRVERAPASLLYCALSKRNHNVQIIVPLRLILRNEAELEARNIYGDTPLLHALHYTPRRRLVAVVKELVQFGANTSAVNDDGETALHLLLRRISACNHYRMSKKEAEELTELIMALLGGFHKQISYPTLGNIEGSTPFDAALSPTAWVLWCNALERAGFDVWKELLDLDVRDGVVHSDEYLEERYQHVKLRPPLEISSCSDSEASEGYRSDRKPCHLCGQRTVQRARRVPFDEFYSSIVDEVGFETHMMLFHHLDKSPCLNAFMEDSCRHLDYSPNHMQEHCPEYVKERSWRRHVAYRMWREGILRSPYKSQQWANGV
jgi:hypothetical protein